MSDSRGGIDAVVSEAEDSLLDAGESVSNLFSFDNSRSISAERILKKAEVIWKDPENLVETIP